ncbi:bifunctional DNA-binding transcriptional regulator/O6-methylguanine-DNA methyltransferase Ada [Sphingomonas swuensis]|uniref:Bifunctional DNA-binding transcriptional regulator/O6-methylguanine-DNA methyltransferase Ada n=1 Tax=Sphingomonas swuensis TaxID=977800 RepID=A0ABP7SQU1_9SPHN
MHEPTPFSDDQAWAAFEARDRSFDGRFVGAVTTTGIYCRPSCPARRPKRENMLFFAETAAAVAAGFRACRRCLPDDVAADVAAVAEARRRIEETGGPLPLAGLGAATGYSPSHLQRIFTRQIGMSPAAFGRAVRLERARACLEQGASVTEAIYEAGYSGPSRFYAAAKALGAAPSAIVRKGAGMTIHHAVVETAFGPMLIGATARGVCHVSFDPDLERLRAVYSEAEFIEDAEAPMVQAAVAAIADPSLAQGLAVDVPGTAFQQRVWAELRKIPPGETRSYLDIARALGDPKATRAVGTANGANPIAVIVPCHRVIRNDGALGGYAGGLERKRALLEAERLASAGETRLL